MNKVAAALDAFLYVYRHKDAQALQIAPPLGTPANDATLVTRLIHCAELAAADQKQAPKEYQTSGEWPEVLRRDKQHANTLSTMFRDDAESGIGAPYSAEALTGFSLRGFAKKQLIRRDMHQDLRVWRAIANGRVAELAAPDIGTPWGVVVDGTLIYPGVCRAHCFALRTGHLLDSVDGDVVAEIGGGYGEMAYRLLRARPATHYVCFDLPEVLLKSSYFLLRAFPEKRVLLYDDLRGRRLTEDLIRQYDITLMPNFMLPQLDTCDVTVNTRSLSEMGRGTVNEYIRHICRFTRFYFMHENSVESVPTFEGHTEVPAYDFPIPDYFVQLWAQKSPWAAGAGTDGRYVEFLYRRRQVTP